MKIVGFMRVWNERDIIAEVITRNLEHFDTLIVLDKGSTDGTWEILQSLDLEHCYRAEPKEDREVEDRRIGFWMARMLKPDWIVQIDSDEILWSFTQPPREILASLADDVDAVFVQAVDFIWNPNANEAFIYNGNESIFENRQYVPMGHRWVGRITRPLPYLQYNTHIANPRRYILLKDLVLRHYSHCVNPERSEEKKRRYLEVRTAREAEGSDMSFVDELQSLDFFKWPTEILVEFEPTIEFRNSLLSWDEWCSERAMWLDEYLRGDKAVSGCQGE